MTILEENFSNMTEKEELLESKEGRGILFSSISKVFIFIAVIWFALYVGDILFGTRSIEALLKVREQEKILEKEIKKQKQENAELQKTLFRYQVLSGQ